MSEWIIVSMSLLFHTEEAPQSVCWDRYNYSSFDDQLEKLKNSRTVYVGNLSYYTTELQIQETFQLVGNDLHILFLALIVD